VHGAGARGHGPYPSFREASRVPSSDESNPFFKLDYLPTTPSPPFRLCPRRLTCSSHSSSSSPTPLIWRRGRRGRAGLLRTRCVAVSLWLTTAHRQSAKDRLDNNHPHTAHFSGNSESGSSTATHQSDGLTRLQQPCMQTQRPLVCLLPCRSAPFVHRRRITSDGAVAPLRVVLATDSTVADLSSARCGWWKQNHRRARPLRPLFSVQWEVVVKLRLYPCVAWRRCQNPMESNVHVCGRESGVHAADMGHLGRAFQRHGAVLARGDAGDDWLLSPSSSHWVIALACDGSVRALAALAPAARLGRGCPTILVYCAALLDTRTPAWSLSTCCPALPPPASPRD